MKDLAKRGSWVALLLVVGVVSRWMPHPPNFSAFLAIALFAGFVLPLPLAMIAPIAAVFLGDLFLGFHDLMWVVYLSLLPLTLLGRQMPQLKKQPVTWLSWGLSGFLASVFFFVTTNLAVWWSSGMYPHTQEGLVSCFVLAIPFFHNSVLATWIYLAGFEVVRRFQPALFPAPQASR
ncbi:MAG: DUF6580 family putative transport protein [Bdellovibrionales bacterium]